MYSFCLLFPHSPWTIWYTTYNILLLYIRVQLNFCLSSPVAYQLLDFEIKCKLLWNDGEINTIFKSGHNATISFYLPSSSLFTFSMHKSENCAHEQWNENKEKELESGFRRKSFHEVSLLFWRVSTGSDAAKRKARAASCVTGWSDFSCNIHPTHSHTVAAVFPYNSEGWLIL